MRKGEIYLINSLIPSYKVVKILKIGNIYISYEMINTHFKVYGRGSQCLHELKRSIIRPLNKKVWYKLIRIYNENRGNIFN